MAADVHQHAADSERRAYAAKVRLGSTDLERSRCDIHVQALVSIEVAMRTLPETIVPRQRMVLQIVVAMMSDVVTNRPKTIRP